MREHFTKIDGKEGIFYQCPDETGCTLGFREIDSKLLCNTCHQEVHQEAIEKEVVYDNRNK